MAAEGHIFKLGVSFPQTVFIHGILAVQDLYDKTWAYDYLDENFRLQNFEIYVGHSANYLDNEKCSGGPFLKIDEDSSYVYDKRADLYAQDNFDKGRGYVWPYGAEIWCNLEGSYVHLVADLSHLGGTAYEMSLC